MTINKWDAPDGYKAVEGRNCCECDYQPLCNMDYEGGPGPIGSPCGADDRVDGTEGIFKLLSTKKQRLDQATWKLRRETKESLKIISDRVDSLARLVGKK